MKYVPNLIPKENRVLTEYFKENTIKKKNVLVSIINWFFGIFFILWALASLGHTLMFIIFGLIGLVLLPPSQRLIEKSLKFNLTAKLKTMICSTLFVISLPLLNYFSNEDKIAEVKQKLIDNKLKQNQIIAEKIENQRKDSLKFYINSIKNLSINHKSTEALNIMNYVSTLAKSETEKSELKTLNTLVIVNKTTDQIQNGNYKEALPEVEKMLINEPENSELIYSRALCFSKLGKIKDAVDDLKKAIRLGNDKAEKLHNTINPIKKKITGYETLCCDGTTSNNRGRGACSRHNGVCDWNHPVYQEYRKYE